MNYRFILLGIGLLFALTIDKGFTQTLDSVKSASIVIVPKLATPKNARQPKESDLGGYLLVYFKDPTHSAYFAISKDGYTFTDVNGGQPIFIGSQLAEQKGVRDPHIARGPDGAFYLAMTDLHIFGQKAGYRDSTWQRPMEKYGWGNNRALVLMKSYDLIHWTHSDFRVDKAFPELGDIDCSWAPEVMYDAKAKKMMVYFTIRYNNKSANIYYSYANHDFTRLETVPKMINDIAGIDADITRVGDTYHMFYVGDAKVWYARSNKINADYKSTGKRIDPEKVSTEAPNVFKRLGSDTYVLMYDVYGLRPSNMGFSETTDFITFKDIGHFNEGVMKATNFSSPKHGAITYLTKNEVEALAEYWKVDLK